RLPLLALALAAALPLTAEPVAAQSPGERIVDLSGAWRFRVGDDLARAGDAFDDAGWDTVPVPSSWEDGGYWGYDGYAWYRRTFTLPEAPHRGLVLRLGRIDDVDQVWVNGHFVGSTGRFPAMKYESAYYAERAYAVPPEYLRAGRNVVAVRVFDGELEGGLLEGPVGLYRDADAPPLALDLSGRWRFRPGDSPDHLRGATHGWAAVTVPAKWEPQGFPDLDGYAWYRKPFTLPSRLLRSDLVLLVGKIDDLHEVYVNGQRIGGTEGDIENRWIRGDEWQKLRAYRLPLRLLRDKNEIAVRVYDGLYEGGIYEGPVGILTEADYERWRHGGGLLGRLRSVLGLD
ncbi:MAG: beta galactosidase jelly roll domain-containing protein, partial [Rhodothermales bacterium]|nr:beta galactosidase jelly roll domain-containing protein [Rhodothermales bacterium]